MVTRVCGSRRERCMAGVPRPNRVAKGRRHRHGSQRHFWVAPSNGFCFEMFVENHGDLNWIDFQVFVDVLSMSFFGPKEREAWAALGWWVIIDDSIHDSRSKDTWNIRPLVGGPAPQLFWYTSRFDSWWVFQWIAAVSRHFHILQEESRNNLSIFESCYSSHN